MSEHSDKIRVLLPEGSCRQVLPMARGFKKSGCYVITVQEKRQDLGNITRYADKKYVIPGVDTDAETAQREYERILTDEKVDLVVPLSDFSAEIFARMKDKVEASTKAKVAVNDLGVFLQAFDKLNTMHICMENNIPCPYTLGEISSIDDIPSDLTYPVVSKPRSSCGSIGLHFSDNRLELEEHINESKTEGYGKILVQEFIPTGGGSKQYNAHFVIDKNHDVKTAILTEKCRWFPIDGGASSLCRTIHNEGILNICEELLKKIGWEGYCDLDLMEDPRDGSVRILEINARISANVKICFMAGADIARQLLDLYFDKPVPACTDYRDDIRLRCIHTDFLWFIKSPGRFHSNPSWFSCKNTHDQIWSIADPFPFFAFSVQALSKYRREMKKRKR